MSRARRRDLVVVGGGSAGLVGALTAARLGARVTLVERERTGGECLWTGCVPSKSLLAAAELAHRMRTASAVGLEPVQPRIDFARVMGHVRDAQARIEPHDSPERLRGEGVEVVTGHARFVAPGRLAVDGRDVAYRATLVATGSRPALPPVEGLGGEALLTTDTVWSLDELPEHLVVLGGGPVGCELAQAFARLGSRVALVEMADGLLPAEEPEAGALLAQRLRDEGVDVRAGVRAERLEDGHLVVAGRTGGRQRLPADRVLVATGRRPATDDMGLEAIGVRTGEDGAVQVDDRLTTTARGVYAAGDVTGLLPFTHVAGHQGAMVAFNALFHARRRFDASAVPWVTFTDPEIARVGLSEAQARERHGDEVAVTRYDYADSDRAVTAGAAYGFAKLVLGRRGRLLGATLAAPAGGEAIAELGALVRRGGTAGELGGTVHPYPTFSEASPNAALEHLRRRWLGPRTRRATRPALALLRALERPH